MMKDFEAAAVPWKLVALAALFVNVCLALAVVSLTRGGGVAPSLAGGSFHTDFHSLFAPYGPFANAKYIELSQCAAVLSRALSGLPRPLRLTRRSPRSTVHPKTPVHPNFGSPPMNISCARLSQLICPL